MGTKVIQSKILQELLLITKIIQQFFLTYKFAYSLFKILDIDNVYDCVET